MKMLSNASKALSYGICLKLSSLFKLSFMFGSQMIWFSGVNSVLPLAGAFGGFFGAVAIFALRQLVHLFVFKTISLAFLSLCIPGFCASLYWTTRHSALRVGLPLLCMIGFMLHPVGGEAFIYSFYWLIPVVLYFVPQRSLFLEALGSTFIAHAVGSVIWCYTVPMTASLWIGLMPIVLCERILFALGMVSMHKAISFIFGKLSPEIDVQEQQVAVRQC